MVHYVEIIRTGDQATTGVAPTTFDPAREDFGRESIGDQSSNAHPDPDRHLGANDPALFAATVEKVNAEWEQRAIEMSATAKSTGYAEGYEAARRDMEQGFEEQIRDYRDAAVESAQAVRSYVAQAEPELIRLAITAAELMAESRIPETVVEEGRSSITMAIEQLAAEAHVDVYMHPISLLKVEECGLKEQLSVTSPIRWHGKPDLREGEWIVGSPRSVIRKVIRELGSRLVEKLASHADRSLRDGTGS